MRNVLVIMVFGVLLLAACSTPEDGIDRRWATNGPALVTSGPTTAGPIYTGPPREPFMNTGSKTGTTISTGGTGGTNTGSGTGGGAKFVAECKDGTTSSAENSQGMCSSHGGVKKWLVRDGVPQP